MENNVGSVEIVAKASDSKSKVEGAGTKKLEVYANSFTVSVTAENGQVRNYVIKINRKDEKGNLGALSKNNKLKELSVEGYNIEFNKDINEYQLEVDNTVETIKVNAVVDDAKATMELDNPTKLKVGKNQIKIKVVSESGEDNTYVINVVRKDNMPVTTIVEAEEVLSKMTASKLEIEIKDDNSVLNKSLISKLKEKEIEVTIKKYDNNKVIYIWNINSKNFGSDFEFNSEIKFDTEKQDVIDKLTNYSNSFYLDFTHSGALPKGTTLTIYVGSKYIDGDRINLYYYNELENKIELINKDLVVKNNGYVTFDIKHCFNYILSKATIGGKVISNDNKFNISFIIAIIEGIVIGGLLLFIGYKIGLFNKLKKNKVVEEGQTTKESINDTKFDEFFTSNDTISNNSVNLDNNSNIVDNTNVINPDNNIFDNNNIFK